MSPEQLIGVSALYHPVADEKGNTQAKIKTYEGIVSGMRAQGKEALPYGVDLLGRPSKVSPFSGPHRDTTLFFKPS